MKNEIEIFLLGNLRVLINSTPVSLPKSKKARALLAYLAAEGYPISKEKLCDVFFQTTKDPRGSLRWCLCQLRIACRNAENSLVFSNSNTVWLEHPNLNVDVHRLSALRKNVNASNIDFEIIERLVYGGFLADINLYTAIEYETWRTTMNTHYDSLREELLDELIRQNLGSSIAVKLGNLFVNFAPHLEKAWYLLVISLIKVNKQKQASYLLRSAQKQLKSGQALQTGLLALAAKELNNFNPSKRCIVLPEKFNRQNLPILVINKICSERAQYDEIQDLIFTSATLIKSYIVFSSVVCCEKNEEVSDVDYFLTPTVKKLRTTYKINLKLTEKLNNTNICLKNWTQLFEAHSNGQMMNEIRKWLAVVLEVEFSKLMIENVIRKQKSNYTATDYYYSALLRIYSPLGYVPSDSLSLLRESLRLDDNLAPALCAMAWVMSTNPLYNECEKQRRKLANLARRSIELAQDDAFIIGWSAITIGHMECNARIGLNFSKIALNKNPQSPMANLSAALMSHYTGEFEKSLEYLSDIERYNTDPLKFLEETCYSLNYYQLGEINKAIIFSRNAVGRNPSYIVALRILTASLANAGNIEEASVHAKRMSEIDSTETLTYFKSFSPYTDQSNLTRLCTDLKKAGIVN